MNSILEAKWPWVDGTHAMRMQLLDSLSDTDLTFTPGGANLTLGALLRELGEIEYAYIESFKDFKQDFSYRNTESGLDSSITRLKTWFAKLDGDMKMVVEAMSDADVAKNIDRSGYPMPVPLQLDVYLQALLIFFGKAVIYLKAMNRPLSQQVADYIG